MIRPEELRAAAAADPFRPFTVHTTDGRAFSVPERAWVAVGVSSASIRVADPDGPGDMFHLVRFQKMDRIEFLT
ncbi:unnamed protein product [Gemmataceae bacterium]|nr:unnamed protein product [Gemmataceae bacterium]VTU02459.1 unnamed protein product [Gemmataceae bacterium]